MEHKKTEQGSVFVGMMFVSSTFVYLQSVGVQKELA